jgi:epoxyqueuosine reductase
MLETAILEWADLRGFRAAWGPARLLDEIRASLESLRRAGDLDPDFVCERIPWFFDKQEPPVENPKSLIVVAVPRPTHSVAFETPSGRIDALLPPTYVDYRRTMEAVGHSLRTEVFGDCPRLELCFTPVKSAATRLGLAKYGRNNITYVEGMGSYHELVGLLTDVELSPRPGHELQEPAPLPECETCDRCIRSCPTGAILRDRFLIRAERCLTNYNESEEPFPEDVPPSAHHCLVGCLVCQRVCPANKGLYKVEDTGMSFGRDETEIFLQCKKECSDRESKAVRAKFEQLGLTEDATLMGRNLSALIRSREERARRST